MKPGHVLKHGAEALLALCLAGMVVCVLGNVELSRLLFVWMVFLGATAAYPLGQHMAFTSLVGALRDKPALFATATLAIRLLVLLACVLLGRGAWQQVVVGMDSNSVVLGYPVALLPLPALLCSLAIGLMVLIEIARRTPLDLGHQAEME